jgi:hypothetical protein
MDPDPGGPKTRGSGDFAADHGLINNIETSVPDPDPNPNPDPEHCR